MVFFWWLIFGEEARVGGAFEGDGGVGDVEHGAFSKSDDGFGVVAVEFFDAGFSGFSLMCRGRIWVEVMWVDVDGCEVKGGEAGWVLYRHVVGGFDGCAGYV